MKKPTHEKLELAVLKMKELINDGHSFTFAKFTASREFKIKNANLFMFKNLESYKSLKIDQQKTMRQNKRFVKV